MDFRDSVCIAAAALAASLATTPVAAQSDTAGDEGAETNASDEAAPEEPADAERETSEAETPDDSDPSGESEADSESGEEASSDARESAHGQYAWQPSFGGGFEYGLFFTDMSRWNSNLLAPNDGPTLDPASLSSLQFALEASLLKGSRFTLFAGVESPFTSNPTLTAVYGGVEPAFAFRRGDWEMALGLGVGLGSVSLETGDNREFSAGLVTLRPVFEVRRYIENFAAGYLRFGFNQWLPFDANTDNLSIEQPGETPDQVGDENLLYEGGIYASLGFRFGQYPKHVEDVPDRDDDGLRDDVDECPDEPEDEDGFEDDDGCPDPDNDVEAVPDDEDECPDEPEDEDGFEDDDGCPDPDNDGDGVPDDEDECPDERGIPDEEGCPSETVSVEGDRLVVDGEIDFEAPDDEEAQPSTELTADAELLLDELAQVLALRTVLSRIEIRAYPVPEADDPEGLAQSRAETVRDHLLGAADLDRDRLEVAVATDADEREADAPAVEFRIRERRATTEVGTTGDDGETADNEGEEAADDESDDASGDGE